MKIRLRSLIVLAVSACIAMPPAHAWNSIGHMAVAYVAYQQLSPALRTRALALLQKNPDYNKWLSYIPASASPDDRNLYIFMMAATWPDEIKAQGSGYQLDGDIPPRTAEATSNVATDKYMHKYWHFVNTPFSTDGTTPLPAIAIPDAQTQIAAFRQVLDDPNASDDLKAYDLVWIMHLVGDVHQPLHCATRITEGAHRGDGGGNSVKLTNDPGDLHGYWDNQLGVGDTKNYQVSVAAAKQLPAADSAAAADANEADWVKESFQLAESSVYVAPIGPALGPYTVDATYAANAHTIAQQRVALAGARLANLLQGLK